MCRHPVRYRPRSGREADRDSETATGSRLALATTLVLVLVAGVFVAMRAAGEAARTVVVGYFDNSNGVFPGDDVRIRGVPVGKVDKIEPQPLRSKISFWFDSKYKVPADAKAVILSPQLVTGRAIQLTPPYTGGPTMQNGRSSRRTAPRCRSNGMTCGSNSSG